MQPQQVFHKNKDKEITSHNFQLQTTQRQAFLQIFNMYSTNGKIDKTNLQDIFQRIGYSIPPQQFTQLCTKIFQINQKVSFEQFMQIFKIKNSSYNLIDIRNAFKLIAGDQDKYIPIDKIITIFKKQNMEEDRIKELLNVLSRYIDHNKKMFDFQMFLEHLH